MDSKFHVTPAEIGVGLTGFGFLFTFLGVVFFFDKGLLAMGNVSFASTSICWTLPAVAHLLWCTI